MLATAIPVDKNSYYDVSVLTTWLLDVPLDSMLHDWIYS